MKQKEEFKRCCLSFEKIKNIIQLNIKKQKDRQIVRERERERVRERGSFKNRKKMQVRRLKNAVLSGEKILFKK